MPTSIIGNEKIACRAPRVSSVLGIREPRRKPLTGLYDLVRIHQVLLQALHDLTRLGELCALRCSLPLHLVKPARGGQKVNESRCARPCPNDATSTATRASPIPQSPGFFGGGGSARAETGGTL